MSNRITIHTFPQHNVTSAHNSSDEDSNNEESFDSSLDPTKRYSDPEMSLKDRQNAINQSHPFGVRLWKPALYKKTRTIQDISDNALHETPVSKFSFELVTFGNVLWSILFGIPVSFVYLVLSIAYVIMICPLLVMKRQTKPRRYISLLLRMSLYMLWPFGNFVSRKYDHSGEYTIYDSLLQRIDEDEDNTDHTQPRTQRESLEYSDLVYKTMFYLIIAPIHYIISAVNAWMIVSIPMAKLNYILPSQLHKNPLSLEISFASSSNHQSEILLCTYSAFGYQYYKYTVEGINIIFINLLAFVVFSIGYGYFVPAVYVNDLLSFIIGMLAVIPLAYFIGMSVASISSQSSLGLGAVLNATFGSIVEIILYALMIDKGEGVLVEGSMIGSFIASLLLLPGISMIAGGIGQWKEQRFNVKSAGVSTVMLIMALIGVFTPTLFYSVFGGHDLVCSSCISPITPNMTNADIQARCTGCSYRLPNDLSTDPVYVHQTKPLMYWCAAILPSAYIIGLLFTLKTHSSHIYDNHHVDKQPLLDYAPDQHPTNDEDLDHGNNSHDAPEWSKSFSIFILLVSTVLFALIAEVLVRSSGVVAKALKMSTKFLGLTIFAIFPSFTEFLNAVMFARQGNVALSLEIGSAYVVQIALIQIPVVVCVSSLMNWWRNTHDTPETSFTLVFPQWDCYSVFFSVFLLSYTYIEGKSNYFKGAIMTLSYLVLMVSFYYVNNEE